MKHAKNILPFWSTIAVYLRKIENRLSGKITLRPKTKTKGWTLLSFVVHPFTVTEEELNKSPHTIPWMCLGIVNILLERGYGVDVIDLSNGKFMPKRNYVMIIDAERNLERLHSLLPKTCVKIFFVVHALWSFQNNAEQKRLLELKERRGVILTPRRTLEPANNIKYADYVISLGNDFAKNTYPSEGREVTQISLFSNTTFPSPEKKNFDGVRKNFVWIGGGGAVHKGLDIVLEYFALMPDYNLSVCGPIDKEEDFWNFYRKELTETPNIKFFGRIDVRGEQFKNIMENSIGLVYPSSSEGQSGAVIDGLHAGLIPIVTWESGVDVEPFGIKLMNPSVDEIGRAVENVSKMPIIELKSRAIAAWQYARTYHTKEAFQSAYAEFIDKIIREQKI